MPGPSTPITDGGAGFAQAALAATTLTDVLTNTRTNRIANVTAVNFCNRGAGATTFRLSLAPLGAADDVSQYLAYDEAIGANARAVIQFEHGLPLSETDVLRAYTAGASVTVTVIYQTSQP